MDRNEMGHCLEEIVANTNIVYAKERHWGVDSVTLMPPAAESDIETLSNEVPFPLPPSYIEFLRLHNGALGFWLRMTLLGTSGPCREIVGAELDDAREHQSQFVVDRAGNINDKSIAKYEKPTAVRKCLYLPRHTVFGTNQRGGFLVFNEKVLTGKEYQVVDYTYDGDTGEVYPDFTAYLRGTLAFLKQRIKQKKY